MRSVGRALAAHFEVGTYLSCWLAASALAAIAGRPWLGAIGLFTVAPFIVMAVAGRGPTRQR